MFELEHLLWVKVPKRYRVTKVGENWYDLESTVPLALEFGRLTDLGPGLRVENKGRGTGSYRVFRISTAPLGDPATYKPELVHIPAGEFWMREQNMSSDPPHDLQSLRKVSLDEYWIGRDPVTVQQFTCFVERYGYTTTTEDSSYQQGTWRSPRGASTSIQDSTHHPVVWVSVSDAEAYCRWLSKITGKHYGLPTCAQWEKAMRGPARRMYPWRNREPNRNVSEWTCDTYTSTSEVHINCDPNWYYYKTRTFYLACGGSINHYTYRHASYDVGFRVVMYASTNAGANDDAKDNH